MPFCVCMYNVYTLVFSFALNKFTSWPISVSTGIQFIHAAVTTLEFTFTEMLGCVCLRVVEGKGVSKYQIRRKTNTKIERLSNHVFKQYNNELNWYLFTNGNKSGVFNSNPGLRSVTVNKSKLKRVCDVIKLCANDEDDYKIIL